jgi:hypothetical protein
MKKIVLILILGLSLTGCSRKVLKTEETFKKDSIVETVKETVIDTSKMTETKIEQTDSVSECEIIITPIDSLRPISVNGLIIKNGIISFKKKSANSKYQKTEKVSQNGLFKATEHTKAKSTTEKTKSEKKIDKKPAFNWWIFIIIILVVLYLVFRFYLKTPFNVWIRSL